MVDIIKFLPHVPTSFSSNFHHLRTKTYNQQLTLPIDLSYTNDRINSLPTKRWIGNYRTNPPRLLDVSNTPYSIHRKVMYQELSRHCPITVSVKNKQRHLNKETTKLSTTTTTGNCLTIVTPQLSVSNGDTPSSRLFDTLSKHVTVKAEPLRPSNSFINSTTNTLTSWQRYWSSTHTQRRRKEATEPEPVLYRPKREQSTHDQTHFVVLRDSPHYPPSELRQYDSRPSTPTNSDIHTKPYNSEITPIKQISSTKEDETKKSMTQISTIELDASSLIRSSTEMNSSTIVSKISTIKSNDKNDDKHLTEKSVLLSSSSHFKSDSQIIEDVSKAQIDPRPITPKVYQLPLPEKKSKHNRKSSSRRRTRSKSVEKKETRTSSASKRKRQISTRKKSTDKSDLSTVITTTSISKYSETKWDEPYVGLRFDPPTPPSSPSLFVWLQDSDQEDNGTSYEKSEIFEHNLPDKVYKN